MLGGSSCAVAGGAPVLCSAARLMVVADDFGVNAKRNAGITAAVAGGVVSHLTLVANGEASRDAADYVRSLAVSAAAHRDDCRDDGGGARAVSAGLHLNVTEGRALSAAPLLVADPDSRRFRGKVPFLLGPAFDSTNAQLVAQLAEEIVAQARWFRDATGLQRFRVDGHHHCHVFPAVVAALCRAVSVLRELYGIEITSVRVPDDALLPPVAAVNGGPDGAEAGSGCPALSAAPLLMSASDCFGSVFWNAVRDHARRARPVFAASGLDASDAFVGLDCSGDLCCATRILDRLNAIAAASSPRAPRRVEMMTHIGRPWPRSGAVDAYFHCEFSCCGSRDTETAAHYELLELTRGRFLRVPAPP